MTYNTAKISAPAEVRSYLAGLMRDRGIPGVQLAVVRGGRIETLDALGMANLEHQVPVTGASLFSINSMAKAFTGVAVMQLVEEGVLDLAAPVARYLGDLPEAWGQVTVRQLATLTSGVPEIMTYTADSNVALIGDGTEDGAWQAAYAMPMEYPTGQGYAYTQTNYALLGKIIDRLSGQPFAQFIAERQFEPAGMLSTRYFNDQAIVPHRADTYMNISVDGDPAGTMFKSALNWPPVLWTAAGLHSTARDLANWAIALQSGALLKQTSSMETLRTAEPMYDGRPGIWGIGWIVGRSAAGRVSAPGGGSKAQLVIYPNGLTVIVLTNLIGAFPEQLAPVTSSEIDLTFIDRIVEHYA